MSERCGKGELRAEEHCVHDKCCFCGKEVPPVQPSAEPDASPIVELDALFAAVSEELGGHGSVRTLERSWRLRLRARLKAAEDELARLRLPVHDPANCGVCAAYGEGGGQG